MATYFDLGAIRDTDLEEMDDETLAELEDQLLLALELDASAQARFTPGRLVLRWWPVVLYLVAFLYRVSRPA